MPGPRTPNPFNITVFLLLALLVFAAAIVLPLLATGQLHLEVAR